MHGAFGALDENFDKQLRALHQKAKETGRFRGYGMNNHGEFWAEGVQSWFHCNRGGGLEVFAPDGKHICHIDTRQQLSEHLPEYADLLEKAFGEENGWVYHPVLERLNEPHLSGYDPAEAPTFRWPQHVVEAYNRIEAERREKRKK